MKAVFTAEAGPKHVPDDMVDHAEQTWTAQQLCDLIREQRTTGFKYTVPTKAAFDKEWSAWSSHLAKVSMRTLHTILTADDPAPFPTQRVWAGALTLYIEHEALHGSKAHQERETRANASTAWVFENWKPDFVIKKAEQRAQNRARWEAMPKRIEGGENA